MKSSKLVAAITLAVFSFSSISFAATFENLRRHIQKNCVLVDREMSGTADPSMVERVFNTCSPGTAIEVIRGCSVPCAVDSSQPAKIVPGPTAKPSSSSKSKSETAN